MLKALHAAQERVVSLESHAFSFAGALQITGRQITQHDQARHVALNMGRHVGSWQVIQIEFRQCLLGSNSALNLHETCWLQSCQQEGTLQFVQLVVASEIEESLDLGLSTSPYTTGEYAQILSDRQLSNLTGSGANRSLLGNEIAVPGVITVVEVS